MTRSTLTLTLAVSVAMLGAPASSLAGTPPAPMLVVEPAAEPVRVGFRVETQGVGGGAEAMKKKILELAAGVCEEQGIEDAQDKQDPRVVVVVERAGSEEQPGYVVGFSIEKGKEIVVGSARQLDCSLCTGTELVEAIEKQLPDLLELAGEHQVPVKGDVGVVDGNGEVPPVVPVKDERKLGGLGFAGIGLGVVGLAGVGAGVGLMVRGVEPLDELRWELRDYRTPGTVILAAGGVALIAGVVMIVLDVSKRKKTNASPPAATRVEPRGLGFAF